MSEVVLSAQGVCKSYHLGGRELSVLKGVNLDLQQGEFVALQGASGSGKSTLLQLLGGLDRPGSGSILFNGSPLRLQTPSQSAQFRGQHVGFVFQAYHLLPDLDALENVMLPAQVQRLSQSIIENRARDLLDKVGLNKRMSHKPSELSGGEQQRVAIARALMNERTHASFEDVKFVAPSVLRHRIILEYNARVEGLTTNDVVASLLDEVPFQSSATPKTLQPTAST